MKGNIACLVTAAVLSWVYPRCGGSGPGAVRRRGGPRFHPAQDHGGVVIASGDMLQSGRNGEVQSRMVFRFKDGSLFEETVVFTQKRVFALQSYRLVQKGPMFKEETEISLERPSGRYRVKTRKHKGGEEKVLEGTLDLPQDVYNGMITDYHKECADGGDRPHGDVHARSQGDRAGCSYRRASIRCRSEGWRRAPNITS